MNSEVAWVLVSSGSQVQSQIILDPEYLPDYLSVSYDFDIVVYAKMPYEKIFEFTAAVRGYHYYRRFWVPKPSHQLYCFFKPNNPFDQFAIKVCEEEGQKIPIGNLPGEISRATKYLTDRGANISNFDK